jgi:lipopolysaccharide/colanic/teichoic acid biosynthesis glycosyltransferase
MKSYKNFKHLIDKFVVIIFSPILFLPLLFLSLFLLLLQGRPIFYVSDRLGKNQKIYRMYKFRTMKNNSIDLRNQDGTTFNSTKDQRVTKIGSLIRKFSLDELPQIINIIKGEMSFVGPRPDLPDQISIYKTNNLSLDRFKVTPGITGYAQVNGRNSISLKQRNQLDLFYINNSSFILDFSIILKNNQRAIGAASKDYDSVVKCREALVFEWKAVVGRSS